MKIGKSTMLLMLVAFCVAAMAGMGIIYYTQAAKDDFELGEDVTLRPEGETTITQEVTELNLVPGTSQSYSVDMKCKAENTYAINVAFTETGNNSLRQFVFVEVYLNGGLVGKMSLDELLRGKTFDSECKLYADTAAILEFRYDMPLNVGNEAKGASASFDVTITVVAENILQEK